MTKPAHAAGARLGRAPAILLAPALLAVAFLGLPLVGLLVSVPWRDLGSHLRDPALGEALWLSVVTSTMAACICLVLGLPLAWLLARAAPRGVRVLRALIAVPLVMPPVVAGVALRAALGRSGLLGEPLRETTGFSLPYTIWGVVVAHVFVALPFVVLAIEGALRSADPAYDAAAATLGASRWTTFRRVTLPLALPGIAAGVVLGWARSLGEFGATITFNGSYPGRTQTLPTLIYVTRQSDADAAAVMSVVMLVLSLAILVSLRERWMATP